jgi:hypothetical protein
MKKSSAGGEGKDCRVRESESSVAKLRSRTETSAYTRSSETQIMPGSRIQKGELPSDISVRGTFHQTRCPTQVIPKFPQSKLTLKVSRAPPVTLKILRIEVAGNSPELARLPVQNVRISHHSPPGESVRHTGRKRIKA